MSEKSPEETLMTTWADVQQRMLVGWLNLLQGTEQPSRKMVWSETVRAWQSTVQETLDAQARWLHDWPGSVQATSGSPTELRKNVHHTQVFLLRWTEAQQHLWQCWFQLVQQLEPLLEADFQTDEHLLSRLRESGQAIINAQTEWARIWTTDVRDQERRFVTSAMILGLPFETAYSKGRRAFPGATHIFESKEVATRTLLFSTAHTRMSTLVDYQ